MCNPEWDNYDTKGYTVKHYENGDSKFSFNVTMQVGSTDKRDSTITIGGIRFNIHKLYSEEFKKDYFILQEEPDYIRIHNSPDFDDKQNAIIWLIKYIKGEIK